MTWRRAAIFGANTSGKSNALLPLELLHQAISHSLASEDYGKRLHIPHLLQEDKPTAFDVDYVSDGTRFHWSLTLDDNGVAAEKLVANPTLRWQKVFERSRDRLTFGSNSGLSQAAQENITQFMRSWTLVLSAWSTLKNPGSFSSALTWWDRVLPLITQSRVDRENRHHWLVKLAEHNPYWLKVLRTVIAAADVGIKNVSIEELAPCISTHHTSSSPGR